MNKKGSEVRKCTISFEMFFPDGGNVNLEGEFSKGEVEVLLSDEQFAYLDSFITREKRAIMRKLKQANPELYDLIAPSLNEAADKIMVLSNCFSDEYIIKGITKY